MRDRVVWAGSALWALVVFALGVVRYDAHRNYVDLGIFTQTAASAFGCFCNPIEGSHWAFHFSPIVYVMGAAIAVWHSPLALVALEAIAGALVAPPVAALVAARAGRSAGRLAAVVVWLYPPLAGLAFNDVHENAFAPAAVAWLLWAFTRRRLVAAALLAVVALCVKEDQGLFLAFAGIVGAYAYRDDPARRGLAAAVAVAGIAEVAAFFLVIRPHAAAGNAWQPTRFYAWDAAALRALWPGGILARLGYLVLALAPLAFVPARTPAAILAIPPFLEVLGSSMPATFTPGSHYAGTWIGYLLFGYAVGIAGVAACDPRRARTLALVAIGLCVVELAVADPLHPGLTLRPMQPRDRSLDAFLATVPRDLDVATQEEAYTHLAARDPNATLLPFGANDPIRACAVLIDRAYPASPRLVLQAARIERLVAAGTLVRARADGTIVLYRARRCAGG